MSHSKLSSFNISVTLSSLIIIDSSSNQDSRASDSLTQLDKKTQLYPRAFHSQSHDSDQALNNHNNDSDGTSSTSPQWGFYVSITPPQQETFAQIQRKEFTEHVKQIWLC